MGPIDALSSDRELAIEPADSGMLNTARKITPLVDIYFHML